VVEEDAIRCMPGNGDAWPRRMLFETWLERVQKTVSAVHIYIVEAGSVLRFRKHQVHRIRWILYAPNSQRLAFVSKNAIDGRMRGWILPTYLEFEPDAPEELETLTWLDH